MESDESDGKFKVEMLALEITCQEIGFEFMTAREGTSRSTAGTVMHPPGACVWSEEELQILLRDGFQWFTRVTGTR